MRHGSLFSGGGGFDLAAYWMGWENVFSVEHNPFADQVLKYRFQGTERHGDIKKFDGKKYEFSIDILSGGFPCQSFSLSGKGAMDLSLWKEMFRVIREINPGSSLPKMCLDLLLGRKDMRSKLCVMTWKAKVLPYSRRLLFQLAVRERRTDGIEFGLLPTPTVMNANTNLEALDKRRAKAIAKHINGNGIGLTLSELLARQMLPTPTHRDYRSGFNPEGTAFKDRQNHSRGVNIHEHIQRMTGPNFRLSHQYHLEMMGFPVDWADIPKDSLKGLERDQSKSPETLSSRKSPSKSSKQ